MTNITDCPNGHNTPLCNPEQFISCTNSEIRHEAREVAKAKMDWRKYGMSNKGKDVLEDIFRKELPLLMAEYGR